jgi:hypothetical protein
MKLVTGHGDKFVMPCLFIDKSLARGAEMGYLGSDGQADIVRSMDVEQACSMSCVNTMVKI